MPSSADAIVVGAGFSGLRAARDLRDAGRSVLLLEGRDRIGGRTWARDFAGTGKRIELGGSWVAPKYHTYVAREMDRYGLSLADRLDVSQHFHWRLDGAVSRDFPLAGDQLYELERALYRIIEASHRIDVEVPRDQQELADLDVSVEDFLSGLGLSSRTHALLSAFGSLGSGARSAEWSALTAFSLIAAFDCSAYAWYAAVADKFAGGTGSVVSALLDDAAPDLRLSSRVTRVEQRADEVVVGTADGGSFTAAAVVLAVPVNVWADIEFEPGLSQPKADLAANGHPNRMVKLWALVEGAPAGAVGFSADSNLLYLAPQYEVDGAALMVGFSAPPARLDVTDDDAIARAVQQFFPDAVVVASEAHDWNADPFSKGAWLTYRPGQLTRSMSAFQAPEGRVSFAGADVATCWIGWLDGALERGAQAAREALAWNGRSGS